MSVEIVTSFDRQSNASDTSMSGAKIYVYDVGTTSLRNVYAASDLSGSPAANPIVCDSAGRHDMRYTATGSYKIVVKTSADVTVYTRDNIDGRVPVGGTGILAITNGGTGSGTAAGALASLGAPTAAEVADLSAQVAALAGAAASTEKTHIAVGTTAQRPASPAEGDIRRNTTVPQWEGYVAAWQKFLTDADIATQAIQETGTSVDALVVSGRQHFNPRHTKAWTNFNGTGTPAVAVGVGVSSITDNNPGDFTLNWTTAFSTANYGTVGSPSTGAAGESVILALDRNIAASLVAPTASAQRLNTFAYSGGAAIDVARVYVFASGDFA